MSGSATDVESTTQTKEFEQEQQPISQKAFRTTKNNRQCILTITATTFTCILLLTPSLLTVLSPLIRAATTATTEVAATDSDVGFPEKYVTENFQEIFWKFSGNFLLNRKNVFIHNVSMKTAENTGKLLHSFKS